MTDHMPSGPFVRGMPGGPGAKTESTRTTEFASTFKKYVTERSGLTLGGCTGPCWAETVPHAQAAITIPERFQECNGISITVPLLCMTRRRRRFMNGDYAIVPCEKK